MIHNIDDLPDYDTITRLFEQHLNEHRQLPESARVRDLGAEKALIQDYSGRVVYELLQNALDRSRARIMVRWSPESSCLEVANDGCPVTAFAHEANRRSDFHAILSLHSSSKTARENIGNKGVGFRSVFAATSHVQVWSRSAKDRWWGIDMTFPSQMDRANDNWLEQQLASFYAPILLLDDHDDKPGDEFFSDYQTVVRLIGVRSDRAGVVEQSVHDLMRLPLRFLDHRAPCPEALEIDLQDGTSQVTHQVNECRNVLALSNIVYLDAQYSTKSNEASTLSGRPSSRRPSSCQKTRAKVFK